MNDTSQKSREPKTAAPTQTGRKSSAESAGPALAEQSKADAVAPRDHNSASGINPMPTRATQDIGDGRLIDIAIHRGPVRGGEILIVNEDHQTSCRIIAATEAITHARNLFRVATTALHEQCPTLAEKAAREFAAELLATADSIGVAAMTPEDRLQKALDER